ncbi:MAG: hypothetical protein Q4C47_08170, partial [Planctomycetia bacterium]|nr:hypothetical protein [Planctomycetia bacterium]
SIEPRLTGSGPATIEFRNYRIERSSDSIVPDTDHRGLTLENSALKLDFVVRDASFTVQDKRTGRTWRPVPATTGNFGLTATRESDAHGETIRFEMIGSDSGQRFIGTLTLDPRLPEFLVTLNPTTSRSPEFPNPSVSSPEPHIPEISVPSASFPASRSPETSVDSDSPLPTGNIPFTVLDYPYPLATVRGD